MNQQISAVMPRAFKYVVVYFAAVLPAFLNHASAAETCYNEDILPVISKLDNTENGIKVTLGGYYVNRAVQKKSSMHRNKVPVICWNEEKGWMAYSEGQCLSTGSSELDKWKRMIPHIEAIPVEDMEVEEEPSIPFYYDGHIWFGIDFYWGEGFIGTGGIGRFTPATKRLEIRRLVELKRVPIQEVVHDGEHLWAATKYTSECIGSPPALGLLKYDWSKNKLTQFNSIKEGPCGFDIYDLAWKNGSLWVATDMGLSRWIKAKNEWLHYLPDKNNPGQVSTVSCPAIYSSLFKEFATTKPWCQMGNDCDVVLLNNLKRFRPDYYDSIKGDHIKQGQHSTPGHRAPQ